MFNIKLEQLQYEQLEPELNESTKGVNKESGNNIKQSKKFKDDSKHAEKENGS